MTAGRPARRGWRSAAAHLLFLVWLEAGYAGGIALFAGRSWRTALWQAAACIAVAVPVLRSLLALLSLPRHLQLDRPGLRRLWNTGYLLQFVLPWLFWAVWLWLLNTGHLSWLNALKGSGAVAVFSYLTGFGLVLLLRPKLGDVEITQLEIPVAGLPQAFDGYQIMLVSDLHAGPLASVAEVERRLAAGAALHADLAVFGGDLADSPGEVLAGAARVLSQVRARDGIVAVLGNHDIWLGEASVRAVLEEHGVQVLTNEHLRLSRGPAHLYLAGVNDAAYTRKDDLAAALARVPDEQTVILLSHAPIIVRRPLAGRAALVLSGHTHGGQIVLPYVGPLYVPSKLGRRYASGLHRINGQWLYVTRGLGEIFPPLRLGCPPEIASLTLRCAASRCHPVCPADRIDSRKARPIYSKAERWPSWSKAHDSKSCNRKRFGGSNPSLSAEGVSSSRTVRPS